MITRWDPYREMISMRRAMDRLMESTLDDEGHTAAPNWGLALDVVEDENAYIVRASVPGVKPEEIDITFNNGTLTIKGEVKVEHEEQKGQYHLRERRYGNFARSISLPTGIDANHIQAESNNGVLTLHLPKAEEVKPKRIAVQTIQKSIDVKTENRN